MRLCSLETESQLFIDQVRAACYILPCRSAGLMEDPNKKKCRFLAEGKRRVRILSSDQASSGNLRIKPSTRQAEIKGKFPDGLGLLNLSPGTKRVMKPPIRLKTPGSGDAAKSERLKQAPQHSTA